MGNVVSLLALRKNWKSFCVWTFCEILTPPKDVALQCWRVLQNLVLETQANVCVMATHELAWYVTFPTWFLYVILSLDRKWLHHIHPSCFDPNKSCTMNMTICYLLPAFSIPPPPIWRPIRHRKWMSGMWRIVLISDENIFVLVMGRSVTWAFLVSNQVVRHQIAVDLLS